MHFCKNSGQEVFYVLNVKVSAAIHGHACGVGKRKNIFQRNNLGGIHWQGVTRNKLLFFQSLILYGMGPGGPTISYPIKSHTPFLSAIVI